MSNNGCGYSSKRECKIKFCDSSWLKIPYLPHFEVDKRLSRLDLESCMTYIKKTLSFQVFFGNILALCNSGCRKAVLKVRTREYEIGFLMIFCSKSHFYNIWRETKGSRIMDY